MNKVLIEKKRDQRPDWSPAQFADVKANDIQSSFFTESQDIPKLKFNKAKPFVDYPTSYGLPSEQVISQIVKGESASYA